MAGFLNSVTLWQGALLSGFAASSTLFSPVINVSKDVASARSLLIFASSVASFADVSLHVRWSQDGINFGSHTDQAAFLASSKAQANSAQWFTVSGPTLLAPYMQVVASGVLSNPTDTRVWATLVLAMS